MSPNATRPTELTPMAPSTYGSLTSGLPAPPPKPKSSTLPIKTPNSFYKDAVLFTQGAVPHSACLAFTIGVVCGVSAWLYYAVLEWALEFLWKTLPQLVLPEGWPDWLWIPIVGFTMAVGVGCTVILLGEPGDLPYTVKCVHQKAYVAMDHVMPMYVVCWFL